MEIKEKDIELVLETWSASMSDAGYIWEQWQAKLEQAQAQWSADYAVAVFATARERWA